MSVLKETGDPRATGDGGTFDRPPYSESAELPPLKKRRLVSAQ